MPRRSPYLIKLSPDQRRELEARARKYTSSYREVIRAKIVLLAAQGLSQPSHRRTLGHAAPDCEQVAKTFLREGRSRA
jgi:hypothetical protein